MLRLFVRSTLLVLTLALAGLTQERVVTGPPPEIRDHIDSLLKAFNSGGAENWESFAQAHFSPAALAQRSAEQRKQLVERMPRADVSLPAAVRKG